MQKYGKMPPVPVDARPSTEYLNFARQDPSNGAVFYA